MKPGGLDSTEPRDSSRGETPGSRRAGPARISTKFIATICARLKDNKRVRRTLPSRGRLHVDRQLPFLCVFRRPFPDTDPGTRMLVVGEASYLVASGDPRSHEELAQLVREIARTLSGVFGSFLVLEIWAQAAGGGQPKLRARGPAFRLVHAQTDPVDSTLETFERALGQIKVQGRPASVTVSAERKASPPALEELISDTDARELHCHRIGLEVRPIYRDDATGQSFPLVERILRRSLGRALKRTFFEFATTQTTHRPPHYHALGRRSMVRAVWKVDQALAQISDSFEFLLLVTPTNAEAAWSRFCADHYQVSPHFTYRQRPVDPVLVKRRLFSLPIERIEDPTLEQLFRDQQIELDRKLTMLEDRGSRRFLYGSLQIFGGVDDKLISVAERILREVPRDRAGGESERLVDGATFVDHARREIEHYRNLYSSIRSQVEVRDDVAGIMVSRGSLLVGSAMRISETRIEPLLQHEVGTHIVTYWNGRAQPFKQLYVGLPGYEELQEGLAVLSEYLVGGLSASRLRILACRVIAVRRAIDGASFVETFKELVEDFDIESRAAFMATMRVYRGGGFTKDAVYLRGLIRLLRYLREGGKLSTLLVGKIGSEHVGMVQELLARGVLVPPPLRPRYMEGEASRKRLERLEAGASPLDLFVEEQA